MSRSAKIVYLSEARIPSRSTNSMQTIRMCEAFQKIGADVTLIHPHFWDSMPEGFEGSIWEFYGISTPFRLHRLPTLLTPSIGRLRRFSRVMRLLPYSWRLWQIFSTYKEPIIFYGRSALGLWLTDWFRRVAKLTSKEVTILIELHDMPAEQRVQRLFSRINGVITISNALARDMKATFPSISDRIWVEPSGVDLPKHSLPAAASRRIVCEQLGLSSDRPIALYAGRVNAEKGATTLLDTAENLEHAGCQLVLVGKVYDSDYKTRVMREGWNHVRLTGFIPPAQIPLYLSAADILLLPSTPDLSYASYTSPLKLFEYMATGRPIIASDLPVLQEILEHERNALLVPATDPSSWAQAIISLIHDPDLRHRLARQASTDVTRYSWEQRARRILSYMNTASIEAKES